MAKFNVAKAAFIGFFGYWFISDHLALIDARSRVADLESQAHREFEHSISMYETMIFDLGVCPALRHPSYTKAQKAEIKDMYKAYLLENSHVND